MLRMESIIPGIDIFPPERTDNNKRLSPVPKVLLVNSSRLFTALEMSFFKDFGKSLWLET